MRKVQSQQIVLHVHHESASSLKRSQWRADIMVHPYCLSLHLKHLDDSCTQKYEPVELVSWSRTRKQLELDIQQSQVTFCFLWALHDCVGNWDMRFKVGIYTQNPMSGLPAQIRDLMGKWEALKRALDQLEKTHISEEIHKVFVKCKEGRVQTLEDLRLILHEHNIPEWLISISKSWWVFQWDNYYLDMMCNYHLTSTKTEMEACGEQPSHAFVHREVK